MAPRIAGVILAGGRGERFGMPKALATLPDSRSFLAACADCLAAAGAAPLVATLPPGVAAPPLPALMTVQLPTAGLAMFDSLRLALARALEDAGWTAAVILPVDHPLVRPATIAALAAADAPAAIPSFAGKHGHPVVLARAVAAGIAAGELAGPTLRDVLHRLAVEVVPVPDPGVTANCNTPDALRAALARAAG